MSVKEQSVYRIFGLRRSGNHAIINWLIEQLGEGARFYNDVFPDCLDLKGPASSDAFESSGQKCLLFSFEDRNLHIAANPKWFRDIGPNWNTRVFDIVITRSVPNLFASRLKAGMTNLAYYSGMDVPELAFQYYKMASDKNAWRKNFKGRLYQVHFDNFVRHIQYRQELSKELGLSGEAGCLEMVDTRFGHGSSFTPGSSKAPATNELSRRWEHYREDPLFQKWISSFALLSSQNSNINEAAGLKNLGEITLAPINPVKVFARRMWTSIFACARNNQVVQGLRKRWPRK